VILSCESCRMSDDEVARLSMKLSEEVAEVEAGSNLQQSSEVNFIES
jgi:hypothetical protein